MLQIVSTPIGNLDDTSPRCISVLKNAGLILAEDTRRIAKIMNRFGISNKVVSYHDNISEKKQNHIISFMKEHDVALVSDAGTPMLSDPGYRIVKKAIEEGIEISPIPGPTAIASALVASGFATDRFMFAGFFPKKKTQQKKLLEEINESGITTVIFESPHRIIKTLTIIDEILPSKQICIAREMTKKFEEFIRGTAREILQKTLGKQIRGEITIVVQKNK